MTTTALVFALALCLVILGFAGSQIKHQLTPGDRRMMVAFTVAYGIGVVLCLLALIFG